MFIIGAEKEKTGPNKGKLVKVVKRQIGFADISSISLSTKCDDIFVIHTPNDYDSVLETVLKTEFVTVVSEKYNLKMGRNLLLKFKDDIEYTVKKTMWQAAGQYEIHFVHDGTKSSPEVVSSGKVATIRIAPGLQKDSRPVNRKNDIQGIYKAAVKQQGNRNASFQSPATNNPLISKVPSGGNVAVAVSNSFMNKTPSFTNISTSNTSLGSASSLAQDAARKKMPPPPPPAKKAPMVKALYDYDANEADELSIRTGDLIVIISKDDPGWWVGSLNGKKGLFPSNYVQDI